MVWVIALASSEVRWNGVLVGRNGVPAPDRASETPGPLRRHLRRAGALWSGPATTCSRCGCRRIISGCRCGAPVHVIEVGPYETPDLPGLADYLPALLMLGALVAALHLFLRSRPVATARDPAAAPARRDRRHRDRCSSPPRCSRVFVAYSYPWHLVRVGGDRLARRRDGGADRGLCRAALRAGLAANAGAVAATALASRRASCFFPWYDLKALGAILAGAAGARRRAARSACARGRPGAEAALAAAPASWPR